MPLLKINAGRTGLTAADGGAIGPALDRTLRIADPGRPVVIMIHGYTFDPCSDRRSPHRHILSLRPDAVDPRAISWPRRLGARQASGALAIAVGWDASGHIWRAAAETETVARALSRLVTEVRARTAAPVTLIAHSLGARVALRSLPHLPGGAVDRMVLMSGAALRSDARTALASGCGRSVEIVNVTSRENDVFDALFETALKPWSFTDRAIGAGLVLKHPAWLDVEIDNAAVRAGLARLGFDVPAPIGRICHWSVYLRPGLFPLYRALLSDANRLTLAEVRAALPRSTRRRWSRLLERAHPALPASGDGPA